MNAKALSDIAYLTSAILFIIGLKFLSHPKRARRGNWLAALGMGFAIIATFIFLWSGGAPEKGLLIVVGILVGGALGTLGARYVAMTDMPQMVALLNGCGGGAAALISTVEFVKPYAQGSPPPDPLAFASTIFGAVIGSLSFWGSLIAFAKLQGFLERAITSPAQ
jgi:NAD(P) transhydrogenase subunit beta